MSPARAVTAPPRPAERRSPPWLAPALLFAAVLLAYANSLGAPFLFDDLGAVQNNPTIRHWSTALFPPADGSTTTGRPLVNLTFTLNYALHGDAVWGYHAGNLLIHAGATLLLYGLARRLFAATTAPALWLALLWAVHPLQTESVTCIAQRTELLGGFFCLLTLWAFARGRPALSVAACALGMTAKETMAVTPLLVLLWDRTFVAGSFAAAWRQRRHFYAALAATWLILAVLMFIGRGARGLSAGFGLGVPGWNYLLTQADALVLYLKLSLWPHPLILDYGTAVVHTLAEVWWQGLLVLALLGGTIWALVRRPALGFAGAWFFLLLAPSSSFVPLVTQTIAEHRMYLPLAAVVALGVLTCWRWLGARTALPLTALALLFTGLTFARNHTYRDPLALWAETATRQPQNARAFVNYGLELLRAGRANEALQQFLHATTLPSPSAVSGHYHAGITLLGLDRVPEGISQLATALALAPDHPDARFALANALVQSGHAAEAIPHYERLITLQPAADTHHNLARALLALGRTDEAIRHLQAALQLDPGLAPAHERLGLLLAQQGRLEEAAGHFLALISLRPADADALANLGNIRLLQHRPAEAIRLYESALRLRPGDARTAENLQLARTQLATP
jgi:tetratricopeptide (TPR) repeat protein